MIFNDLLLHVHCRLVEIFCCRIDISFAEITITVVGDFLQLPPVKARPVYVEYERDWLNFAPLWKLFKIAELTLR